MGISSLDALCIHHRLAHVQPKSERGRAVNGMERFLIIVVTVTALSSIVLIKASKNLVSDESHDCAPSSSMLSRSVKRFGVKSMLQPKEHA